MVKKLFLAAVLVIFSGIFITGCSSYLQSNSSGVVGQSQPGQGPVSQSSTPGSANDTANTADRYVRLDNGEGGVQVEAIWITPEYLKSTGEDQLAKRYDFTKNVIIEIGMTAHMGDLTQYPILEKASLTVDGQVIKPASWDTISNDAHHPRGFLVFPAKADINNKGSKLQLSLKDLNGIPDRTLSW